MGQPWLGKIQAQTSFQIDLKRFQKVAMDFFKMNYLTEFSTD